MDSFAKFSPKNKKFATKTPDFCAIHTPHNKNRTKLALFHVKHLKITQRFRNQPIHKLSHAHTEASQNSHRTQKTYHTLDNKNSTFAITNRPNFSKQRYNFAFLHQNTTKRRTNKPEPSANRHFFTKKARPFALPPSNQIFTQSFNQRPTAPTPQRSNNTKKQSDRLLYVFHSGGHEKRKKFAQAPPKCKTTAKPTASLVHHTSENLIAFSRETASTLPDWAHLLSISQCYSLPKPLFCRCIALFTLFTARLQFFAFSRFLSFFLVFCRVFSCLEPKIQYFYRFFRKIHNSRSTPKDLLFDKPDVQSPNILFPYFTNYKAKNIRIPRCDTQKCL